MLEILRDPVWEFVGGVFLGLVAIVVTIALSWTQRRRKALSYEIISRTSLLSIEDEIKGKLEISFNGRPVQDVHLIVFKIINSGNVPIVSTDYERSVSLTFGENSQILSAEVSETNPDNLQASVDIEATRVVLEPVLLNGGDSITLKFLVSRLAEISIDGRIVGVKDIRKPIVGQVRFRSVVGWAGFLFLYVVFLLIGVATILSYPGSPYEGLGNFSTWGLIGFLGVLLIGAAALPLVMLIRNLIESLSQG